MFYIYPEKNLWAYPGTIRETEEWAETYKICVNSFYAADRKTQNEKNIHADLLLAEIAQLITVIVADKMHKHQYTRNLKPLIA